MCVYVCVCVFCGEWLSSKTQLPSLPLPISAGYNFDDKLLRVVPSTKATHAIEDLNEELIMKSM